MKKLIVAAEPLSPVKRKKLETAWGAEVFDHFGMTEGAFVAGEGVGHHGLHIWADQFYCEVVDEKTGEPVPEGAVGSLVVTPLWNNCMTPFLRWSSGDLVSIFNQRNTQSASLVRIPDAEARAAHRRLLQGARRQHQPQPSSRTRCSAIRMWSTSAPRCTTTATTTCCTFMWKSAPARGRTPSKLVRRTFQITPEVTLLPRGQIAKDFEAAVKPPRFVDKRG